MKIAIPDAMLEATRLTRAGRLGDATALLRRLLGGHEPPGGMPNEDGHSPPTIDGVAEPPRPTRVASGIAPEGFTDPRANTNFERPAFAPDGAHRPSKGLSGLLQRLLGGEAQAPGIERLRPTPSPEPRTDAMPGKQLLAASFSNQAGTRPYKLFVPSGYRAGVPVPLIVMLHGCTQSPDDFAAGTRMNDAAEAHTCLVAWPEQIKAANIGKCWNWFIVADLSRDTGEPSLIAGITRQIMRDFAVDPNRVYVAGLSAGGAAAAIMGAAYPDLYAAIGVHSGLPCGAARDMASAMSAMKRGGHGAVSHGIPGGRTGMTRRAIPAIVFHGGGDTTVNPRNGDAVVSQLESAAAPWRRVEDGHVPGGHAWRRTSHVDAQDRPLIEYWEVRGAGHAWSGGSPAGSYTDPRGPDATKEMLRFFLEHPRVDGPS